jgi:DNA replication and repair protein RecF
LKQRNALLRQHQAKNDAEFDYWEQELVQQTTLITQYRRIYLDLFFPILEELLATLLPIEGLTINFAAGWDQDKDFLAVLKQARVRDGQIGYTQHGAHRADLKFRLASKDADEILSRGQQKLLSVALRLAQGIALFRFNHKQCIYLIDDLPAELDAERMAKVVNLLAAQQSQVFITAIASDSMGELVSQYEMQTFHVEH